MLSYFKALLHDCPPVQLGRGSASPRDTLDDTYHDYGAAVAAALAVYDCTIGPIEGHPGMSEEEKVSLRGLLNFASLSMYGANARCFKPEKGGSQGKKSTVPLNQIVFQKLKMRAKDIEVIITLQESALVFAQILRAYMSTTVADDITPGEGVPLVIKGVPTRAGIGVTTSGSSLRACFASKCGSADGRVSRRKEL